MALHKGPDGWCHPSQATVGRLLGRTRQAIQRHLRDLVRLGYIEQRTVMLPNRTKQSDYRLIRGMQPQVARGSNHRLRGMQLTARKGSNHRLHKEYTTEVEGTPVAIGGLMAPIATAAGVDHEAIMAELERKASRAARRGGVR